MAEPLPADHRLALVSPDPAVASEAVAAARREAELAARWAGPGATADGHAVSILANVQDGWNRKGLVGENGTKKKAFYVLKDFYDQTAQRDEAKR